MFRPIAQLIDDYRIWHKVTFERGRILTTRDHAWEEFDRPDKLRDPSSFFAADGRIPDLQVNAEESVGPFEIARFEFPSLHPIEGYSYEETNRAAGLLYRRRGDTRAPVVILSHGWAHDDMRAVRVIYVEPLLKAGFSVAVPAQPFHFERTPRGTYSGELMVSGDVVLTVEAFRQGVADICGLINWLRDRGNGTVGLLGYSMGGYFAGLTAAVRGDLDFVVVAAAGDSVVSPILDTGLGVNVREDLSRTGMHLRENLERAWAIISPGRLAPRVPQDRLLLVAGRYDRIMLHGSVARLWQAWGRPAIRWEDQGHYTLLAVPGRLIRRCLPFLRERCSRG